VAAPHGLASGLPPSQASRSGGRVVITIALSLFSTTIVTAGLGFVFWAVAAHATTVEVVGRSSAVISAMQLIATFATLGFHTLLIAELPRRNDSEVKRLVVSSLGIAAGVAFAAAAGYSLVYHATARTAEWMYANPIGMGLFGVGTALTTVAIVLDGALIGVEKSGQQVLRNFIFALSKLLALPVAAIAVGLSPAVVFLVWLLGNAASLLILGLRTKTPKQWAKTTPSVQGFYPLWRTAAGHHWVNVATQAPRLAMPVIVATQLSDRANAGFFAALLLVGFVWIVPNHLATGMFALSSENTEHFERGLNTAIKFSAVVSLLAAAATPFLARPLLAIFGAGYEEARYCLIALAACTFASAVKSIYIGVRRAEGALGRAAGAASIGGALELAAVVMGLKLGGVTGVGIALGAAMVLEAVVFWPPILKARRRARQQAILSGYQHESHSIAEATSNQQSRT
jgi:O-antigen/teichoic acid export membrane protein